MAKSPRYLSRSPSKNSRAPARKYALLLPITKARNTVLSRSISIFLRAIVKRISTAEKMRSSGSRCWSLSTLMWLPFGNKLLNFSNTTKCSNLLGKAEREIVTAATTPAYRSWLTVASCSMIKELFFVFGLMHRMYRVCVLLKESMRRPSWLLNFVQTVSAAIFEFFLVICLLESRLVRCFRRCFLGSGRLLVLVIESLFNSLAMMWFVDIAAHCKRSEGNVSLFFTTKFVAS
mmetsp:Transcript_11239/g.27029  ORF Transcript_11239/g.27029 Transcript_11239/m.27029 type:complete len:233 (+) Transcript_11239:1397-2095(+)